MKISLLLCLIFLTSCSSAPSPKSCNDTWDFVDNGVNRIDSSNVKKKLHSDKDTYRDRECNEYGKEKGQAIFDVIRFADTYRTDFESWTSDQRNHLEDVQDDQGSGHSEKILRNLDNQPIPYPDSEVADMIQDLKLKTTLFNQLKKNLKMAGRELQYAAPIHFKRVRDWIKLETPERDQKLISKYISHLENKKKQKIKADENKATYQSDYKTFLANSSKQFDKAADHFSLEVVRGDGVDSFGLSLGETIFRLQRNKMLKLVVKSFEGDFLALEFENIANKETITFNFELGKYSVLKSTQTKNGKFFGHEAMVALMVATN